MRTRLEFSAYLKGFLSEFNKLAYYFDPPETKKMTYPCIVYSRSTPNTSYANDLRYSFTPVYDCIYITADSEIDDVILKLLKLPSCSIGKPYKADNVYHYPFSITY